MVKAWNPAAPAAAPLIAALLAAAGTPVSAQGPDATHEAAARTMEVRAVRIADRPPVIDGRLDDAVWQTARPLDGFVQLQPEEGAPATEATEVRFLYDDHALYVGARMYSRDPDAVQAPVSRRDAGAQAEHILVSIDSYLDRRTAYTFGVTAAGTRLDWYHPIDDRNARVVSFDPVWEARVARDSLGWTAEMRIPFSQLRFTAGDEQVWGVNVARLNAATREETFWVLVPPREQGWSSRFGRLAGLSGIRPARRIELLPYAASAARLTADPGEGNPFDSGAGVEGRFGGDLKAGLGPNLTFEATVNPDFGQVEADPAQVNLTAFETFFPEQRPFFVEGSQLLQGRGPEWFYSRRIGAAPRGPASGDFVDYPRTSTILGAGKLTGRLAGGTSLGALGAVTRGERARVFDLESGEIRRVPVAPLTGFGVFRTQQEIGESRSTLGTIFTGVRRDLAPDDPLSAFLHRQAVTGAVDGELRLNDGEYAISGWAGFSHVTGEPNAIARTQLSSARYLQRPDATHVSYDPERTSLSGYTGALSVARRSGRHWLWSGHLAARSPGLELNDIGAIGLTDWIYSEANLRYRQTRPGSTFRNYSIGATTENSWDFGGTRIFSTLRSDVGLTWLNDWRTTFTGWVDLRAQSPRLTRGGPLMEMPQSWQTLVGVSNPASARTRYIVQTNVGGDEVGSRNVMISGSASVRPGPRWQAALTPRYTLERNARQYVTSRVGGSDATFGRRYVFGEVDQRIVSLQGRFNYLFTPDLSLEIYAEPFAASGRFSGHGELAAARTFHLREYGTDGTTITQEDPRGPYLVTDGDQTFTLPHQDFNVRSFRSNAVLRWEWRPGSTLFAVWQQDRFGFDNHGRAVTPFELRDAFSTAGDNYLTIKATYWIPVR